MRFSRRLPRMCRPGPTRRPDTLGFTPPCTASVTGLGSCSVANRTQRAEARLVPERPAS